MQPGRLSPTSSAQRRSSSSPASSAVSHTHSAPSATANAFSASQAIVLSAAQTPARVYIAKDYIQGFALLGADMHTTAKSHGEFNSLDLSECPLDFKVQLGSEILDSPLMRFLQSQPQLTEITLNHNQTQLNGLEISLLRKHLPNLKSLKINFGFEYGGKKEDFAGNSFVGERQYQLYKLIEKGVQVKGTDNESQAMIETLTHEIKMAGGIEEHKEIEKQKHDAATAYYPSIIAKINKQIEMLCRDPDLGTNKNLSKLLEKLTLMKDALTSMFNDCMQKFPFYTVVDALKSNDVLSINETRSFLETLQFHLSPLQVAEKMLQLKQDRIEHKKQKIEHEQRINALISKNQCPTATEMQSAVRSGDLKLIGHCLKFYKPSDMLLHIVSVWQPDNAAQVAELLCAQGAKLNQISKNNLNFIVDYGTDGHEGYPIEKYTPFIKVLAKYGEVTQKDFEKAEVSKQNLEKIMAAVAAGRVEFKQ